MIIKANRAQLDVSLPCFFRLKNLHCLEWDNFLKLHLKHTVLLLLLLTLSGCASHLDGLSRVASTTGGKVEIIRTSKFDLVSASISSSKTSDVLRVYIEGDGKAWSTRSQPSTDPSPRNLFIANLALSDSHPAVYLARPCQFHKSPACGVALWTDERFSAPVVQSFHEALNKLKARHRARSLELIGYSGGGYIALLLAGKRTDVLQVQTIAGNLDPTAWALHHKLSPMHGLKNLDTLPRLKTLPQRHFVGTEDKVVPPALVDAFVSKNSLRCATVRRIAASHESGWSGLVNSLNVEVKCP